MKLTSETWKNGIADSHYTGVANLRNVRIDDVGVLRVMNRPQIVADLDGEVLEVRRSYYDSKNHWQAVIKESTSSGFGEVYNSIDGSTISTQKSYSGGVNYRNYFIPFPATPNVTAGYLTDTTSDGIYDTSDFSWDILVTKGQTQTQFINQTTPTSTATNVAMLDDDTFVRSAASTVIVQHKDGTVISTITSPEVVRSLVGIGLEGSSNERLFVVVCENNLYTYNVSGTLIHTLPVNMYDDDELENISSARKDENEIIIMVHERDPDGSNPSDDGNGGPYTGEDVPDDTIRLWKFDWDSVTQSLSQDDTKRVFNGGGSSSSTNPFTGYAKTVSGTPRMCVTDGNEDVVVLMTIGDETNQGTININFLGVYSGSSLNEQYSILDDATLDITDTEYGPMVGTNNGFFMFGAVNSQFNWDNTDVTNVDSSVILNTGGISQMSPSEDSNDYYVSLSGTKYTVHKLNIGEIDKTHSLVGIDDVVYYANGNNIGTIQETTPGTFNPGTSSTYDVNTNALDLPEGTKITALAEIGEYLSIGTQGGKVFFWDRKSDSFTFPVNIGEPIGALKSKNNLLYITSQNAGNVYIANLSSYEWQKNLSSLTPSRFDTFVSGMEFFDNGAYMGGAVNSDPTYTGIWVYKNGVWSLIGTESAVSNIEKVSPSNLVFSSDGQIFSLEISGNPSAVWSDGEAYMVSPMELNGTVNNKSKQTNYSMYFDNPFGINEYVKLYYRTTTGGDWNFLQEVTSQQLVAESGLFAFRGQLSIPKSEQMQFKIELNTTAGLVLAQTN